MLRVLLVLESSIYYSYISLDHRGWYDPRGYDQYVNYDS